jgi:hypothetical protein
VGAGVAPGTAAVVGGAGTEADFQNCHQ